MPTRRLTSGAIDKLPSSPKGNILYWDESLRGFGVRVTPGAARSYVVQFRPKDGSGERRLTLGRHGVLTLDQARRLARIALGRVAGGANPVAERAADRRNAKRMESLESLGREYFADAEAYRKESTLREYRRLWRLKVLPVLGKYPVRDVTADDIARLQRSMRKTPVSANRTLALLGSFFRYVVQQGAIKPHEKPTTGIRKYREVPKGRALIAAELRCLFETLDRAEREGLPTANKLRRVPPSDPSRAKHTPKELVRPANPFSVNAIRLLCLTGWRPGEVATLRWDSLDLERSVLTLRESKTGYQVRPIGAACVALLAALPRVSGSPYVFPGSDASTHLGDLKRFWTNVREAAGLGSVRLYDLRHTHITHGVEAHGVAIMQKVVGHKSIKTTLGYTHFADGPLKQAADAVAGDFAAHMAPRTT